MSRVTKGIFEYAKRVTKPLKSQRKNYFSLAASFDAIYSNSFLFKTLLDLRHPHLRLFNIAERSLIIRGVCFHPTNTYLPSTAPGEDPTTQSKFNWRMDILFAESCRDNDGRLYYARRGKLGMALVVQCLREVEWSEIPGLARPSAPASPPLTAACRAADAHQRGYALSFFPSLNGHQFPRLTWALLAWLKPSKAPPASRSFVYPGSWDASAIHSHFVTYYIQCIVCNGKAVYLPICFLSNSRFFANSPGCTVFLSPASLINAPAVYVRKPSSGDGKLRGGYRILHSSDRFLSNIVDRVDRTKPPRCVRMNSATILSFWLTIK
ncbi:hypothetical protein K438DRAFT_1776069 [Mycena galopus ATCC 62051]|nr:hypothetical protein K438DRAFT_1776069 [Mycena galopus ATCC 62051]